MAEAEAKAAVVDPVAGSFLAIADILEALAQVQPAVAGPKVAEALATIRGYWTNPPETEPPVE